jgi:mono/diheme cytochrome c family protein
MKTFSSLKISQRIFVAILFLFLSVNLVSAQPDGEALFKANCTQCHAIGRQVIGPDLKAVDKRRPKEWLHKWIHNSQAVVKSGDPYAVELFNKFNKTVMTSFNLKDDEIDAIITYIANFKPPVTPNAPGAEVPGAEPKSNLVLYLLIAGIVLYIVIRLTGKVQRSMEKVLRQREGLPEPVPVKASKRFVHWARNNKKLVALILIVIFVWSNVKGWYLLAGIGIAQGYQPEQPIAFSHKIHAGDNAINCKYCHFGAEKGKTAGIPSANVCMNCHKYIQGEADTSKAKIAKIYKALDYNPATQTYGPNQKPIQWVRVHNLSDLSYFNHSQHVKVAGVECQTCHGSMQEQGMANQYAPLTMGWCIDCHRRTPVPMAGNHYYDDYHKELLKKFGSDSLITVERIGGTECARCHY